MAKKIYRPNKQSARQPLRNMWQLGLMFIVTVLFASGLQNHAMGLGILYLSFVYPATAIFTMVSLIPSINYSEINSEGIVTTRCGFIHKSMRWSDVEQIGAQSLAGIDGLGVSYKSSASYHLMRSLRRRSFGWDELISDGYDAEGASFVEEAVKHFKKYIA